MCSCLVPCDQKHLGSVVVCSGLTAAKLVVSLWLIHAMWLKARLAGCGGAAPPPPPPPPPLCSAGNPQSQLSASGEGPATKNFTASPPPLTAQIVGGPHAGGTHPPSTSGVCPLWLHQVFVVCVRVASETATVKELKLGLCIDAVCRVLRRLLLHFHWVRSTPPALISTQTSHK